MTLDDIAAAVRARCVATASFTAALPGGAWLDRGPEEPAGDYAVFTLERAGEPEFDSSGTYLQDWTLRMVAYTVAGKVGSGTPQAAQLAMVAAINPLPTSWTSLRDGRVNICLPAGYDGKHEPTLREGKDVFAAAGQWKLLVEGNHAP